MANKKTFKCDDCKYYNKDINVCEHESNIVITLHRRIEKKGYKNVIKKTECEFWAN